MVHYEQICSPQSNLDNTMKAIKLLHKIISTACHDLMMYASHDVIVCQPHNRGNKDILTAGCI